MNCVLVLLLCLLTADPAWGAVAYVTSVTATETGQDGAVSLSIDVGAGSNRFLICGVHFANGSNTISGVTHNGVALTQSTAGQLNIGIYFLDVWYLIAPASGSQTVTATMSGTGSNKILTCMAFTGVHQTTPLGSEDVFAATADPSTATITVPAGGMGVAFNTNNEDAGAGAFTVDGASTKRFDLADTDANIAAIGSTKSTAETAAMTVSNATGNYSVLMAFPILAAGASQPRFSPVTFE